MAQHATRLDLRVFKHLGHRVDGPARHTGGVQRGNQRLPLPGGKLRTQQAGEFADVAHALRIGREAFVAHPVGMSKDAAEFGKLPVIAHHQNYIAIGAGIHVLRLDVGVGIAVARRHLARHQVVHGLVGQRGHLHVQHGDVDGVAQAGFVAPRQCGQHRDRRVHAGHQIDDRDTHLLRPDTRPAVLLAGHAHQATHGLDQEVVRGLVAPRAGLAEAGDRAINQSRIQLAQRRFVQAIALQRASLVIFEHDVALQRQLAHDALAFGFVQAHRDGAFAPVHGQVIPGLFRVLPVRTLEKRRPPGTRVVTRARALHLDYLGPQVGQYLAGPGRGQDAAQVEHLDVRQRAGMGVRTGAGIALHAETLHGKLHPRL